MLMRHWLSGRMLGIGSKRVLEASVRSKRLTGGLVKHWGLLSSSHHLVMMVMVMGLMVMVVVVVMVSRKSSMSMVRVPSSLRLRKLLLRWHLVVFLTNPIRDLQRLMTLHSLGDCGKHVVNPYGALSRRGNMLRARRNERLCLHVKCTPALRHGVGRGGCLCLNGWWRASVALQPLCQRSSEALQRTTGACQIWRRFHWSWSNL